MLQFVVFFFALRRTVYFFKFSDVFRCGEEEVVSFFLVGRSSSSDRIGLFRFVIGIVQDCCESFGSFS